MSAMENVCGGCGLQKHQESSVCKRDDGAWRCNDCQRRVDRGVDHPTHYNEHPSGIECITVAEHMGFNIGNAIKYLWRAGRKDATPTDDDLRKAIWYIERERKRLRGSDGNSAPK